MKVLLTFLFFFLFLLEAKNYPNKTINIIVAFGEGGSTDRMTRTIKPFLEKEFKTNINIINIKGKGTLEASKYFMDQESNGYTIFASTFSPYLHNIILHKEFIYSLEDFAFINMQWFDYDLIAVNKNSKFNSILDLLYAIKNNPKKYSVAILPNSSASIVLKLLLKKMKIPQHYLNIKYFNGGKLARNAIKDLKVNFIIIGANGSEKYRKFLKPLCVITNKRSKRWDAPTLNEALKKEKISMPIIQGSIRGFAVSSKFKTKYPKRYNYLLQGFKNVLASKKAQKVLKNKYIGYTWMGSNNSTKILQQSFLMYKNYQNIINY